MTMFMNINFILKVWNSDGGTVFPDFTHPKASQFWKNQISNFHGIVNFDGLWLVSKEI